MFDNTERLYLSTYCSACNNPIPISFKVLKQEHVKLDHEYNCTTVKIYSPDKCPCCGNKINYIWATDTFSGEDGE